MRSFRRPVGALAPWQFGLTQWWLQPVPLLLLTMLLYLSFLGFNYESMVPRRYVPNDDYWWGLLLLATLAAGTAVGRTLGRRPASARVAPATPTAIDVPPLLMALLLAATVIAYVVWFGPLAFQPGAVVERFTGERTTLRTTVTTQPGITTLTQCGVAYVILYVLKQWIGIRRPVRWERWGLVLVFVLAIVRSLLWSERLAVIELVVPYVVLTLAFFRFRSKTSATLVALLPVLAPLTVYLLFTVTEYFRSWTHYRDYYDSIWQFSLDRITAYYALATNSGLGLLAESRTWPQYTGTFVFEWAYLMPGLGDVLLQEVGNLRHDFERFLADAGRAEFNNPTGLFVIVYDIGYVGSWLYFLLVGLLVGACWTAFRRHRLGGLLAYPLCFMFLLELLRFNYFAASRFIPIAASLVLAWVWILAERKSASPRGRPALQTRQEV